MIFINPKTDFAFKKIFGSDQSKDILISFLNAILYNGNSTIEDLEILNPYQAPKIRGVKDTYLDIKAKLDDDTKVIIEMQVLNVEGFEKRILYNAAKSYSIQLDQGEDYTLLNPVIALTITDFEMFELDTVISRFVLKEKNYLADYTINDLELVFVELPKFNKELDRLETLSDQWIYFLNKAKELTEIPAKMEKIKSIKKAFLIAKEANLSREELEDFQKREMFINDQKNAIKKAVNQATKKVLDQGIKQGEKQKAIEIAQKLIGVMDDATIAQTTGLTLAEINNLKTGV
jgi:predicted transposase/invertase (TIGR01784 family)